MENARAADSANEAGPDRATSFTTRWTDPIATHLADRNSPLETTRTELEVSIVNRQGLHARPAAQFVRVAGQFEDCEVTVHRDGMSVNGKSIMGMMMLAAGPGSQLKIVIEGDGSEELGKALVDLIEGGFGEDPAVQNA